MSSLPVKKKDPTGEPISHVKVLINGDEEVVIDARARNNYWLESVYPVPESAFNCSACRMTTIHDGYEMRALAGLAENNILKRVYLCTNCGAFRSK